MAFKKNGFNSGTKKRFFLIYSVLLLIPVMFIVVSGFTRYIARAAATIIWDGGGDGLSWSDPLNWDTDGVPTNIDFVLIDTTTTVIISAPLEVNSLVLGQADGSVISTLEFAYDAISVGPLTIATENLTVYPSSKVTHKSASAGTVIGKVNINVQVGDANIYGSIDVSERGFPQGYGPGAGGDGNNGSGGAAHGGYGGKGLTRDGSVISYGSYTNPVTLGSGGGRYFDLAGAGGGAVKLTVAGTTTINGSINADGGYGNVYGGAHVNGGGAGGSISIISSSITGSGSLSADGGSAGNDNYDGGGGAGGRIALYFDNNTFGSSQLSSMGGKPTGDDERVQKGGAGTIFLKDNASTNGDLLIDNEDTLWEASRAKVAYTQLDSSVTLDNLTIDNYANVLGGASLTVVDTLLVDNIAHFGTSSTVNTDNLTILNNGWVHNESSANIAYTNGNLSWSSGILEDNGGTFALLSGGGDLTIPTAAALYINLSRSYSNVVVDGLLSHTENIDVDTNKLNLIISGNLTVNSAGEINVTNKGYDSGQGPGVGGDGSNGSGGAAHGGYGGDGFTRDGSVISYGSYTNPVTLGSGGGQYFDLAGAGGGAVKLTVSGTTTINGSIKADGGYGNVYAGAYVNGGGAGGSIWITSSSITGSGSLSADGGSAGNDNYDGGGGAGGRIALYFDNNTFGSSQLSSMGGKPTGDDERVQKGGAGTIFLKDNASTNGDLLIDNEDTLWETSRAKVAYTQLDSSVTLDNLTIDNYANVLSGASLTVVDTLLVDNISYFGISSIASTDSLDVLNDASLFNNSGATITYGVGNLNWSGGVLVDNGGTLDLLSGAGDVNISANSVLKSNIPRTYVNIVVDGELTHSENEDTEVNKIDLTLSGDLTINGIGSINVDEKGYTSGYGLGAGGAGSNGAGGAAHAGFGGNGETWDGSITTYGSYIEPYALGSGGGDYFNMGGSGGGVIKLNVSGNTVITGEISADGGKGMSYAGAYVNGGGAGGSIWLNSNSISGSGIVTADGGGSMVDNYEAGGGSGGRIALYFDSNSLTSSQFSVAGGEPDGSHERLQKGGAGTIYLKDSTETYGDLIVDNNNTLWSTDRDKVAETPLASVMTLRNLTIDNYADVKSGTSLTVTDTLLVDDKSYFDVTGTVVTNSLDILNDAYLYNQNSANITYGSGLLNWSSGILVDNGGIFALLSGAGDITVPTAATLESNVPRTYINVIVDGILSHSANNDVEVSKINMTVTNDMTVNLTGSIDVTSKGFSDGNGTGAGEDGSNGSGGGGYGGVGGDGQNRAGGITYGDELAPDRLGSAGGLYFLDAGHGGGSIKLDISGAFNLLGSVKSNGGLGGAYNGYHGNGGGSGGSVWITTTDLNGTGYISADGGGSIDENLDGGGGGGGRIALYFDNNNSTYSSITVYGGLPLGASALPGTLGTIFLGGTSADPINLRQYKNDGVTAISTGASTNETEIVTTFQVQDSNTSDVLTPEVEILPIGTDFNNIGTNFGDDVNYSGTIVTATVAITGLANGTDYHWQSRVCDSSAICSNWVSFGSNIEAAADVRIVTNALPNTPVIPGSSFFINSQFTNFLQPTLSFVLSDPNSVDSVGYQIQLNTSSDFSVPTIDYISPMGAQDTQAFTVGQAEGTGTYNIGAEAQELTTGQYYWRVRAIDDKGGISDWTVAVGTPSFLIDLSAPNNATNVRMKSHAADINEYTESAETVWFSRDDLYFSWDAGSDAEGVKGYCVYLGLSAVGDPATDKGILGTSPQSTTGTTCEFITDQTEIDFTNSALRGYDWLESNDNKYYFKVETIDIANNVFSGADDTNFISFNFDNTPPENVTAISAPSSTFSSTSDMNFNWSVSPGQNGSDENSGLLGFDYAVNSRDTWFGEFTDATTGLDYSLMTADQPYYFPQEVQDIIQLGVNTIYFRTLDNAGNYSELRTAFINYGGEAPKFADGDEVTATPSTNDVNNFGFSWPAATPSSGNTLDTYYYMINTTPPASYATINSNSATYVTTSSTTLAASAIAGLRKGANTIYVVAVDNLGNYSPTNSINATFYLNSELPDPPVNISVADGSIKDASLWRAAIVWEEPSYKGTGDILYHVERSDDGNTWTEVATTNSLAYVDTVSESKQYYWRIGTTDNSDESIAAPSYSSGVSIIPRGKYLSPAILTSGPAISSITTTKATASWTTHRTSDSKVAFGLASGNYFESELSVSAQVTDHTVDLTNLTPGTLYFFRAKWTDEDGNNGQSDEQTFETALPPEVKNVRISNRGINSAMINFTTKYASSAKIYYGTSTGFGGMKEVGTSQLETSYSVQLDNLIDGTKYYYKINTFDAEGEEYEGTILDFETLPRPKVSNILIQQVAKTAQSTLLVTWESNTAISSVVTYNPSSDPTLARDNVDIKLVDGKHSMLVKGLFPDTEYEITVRGKDVIGNEAISETVRIITSTDSRAPQVSEMSVEGTNIISESGNSQTTTSQLIVTWTTDEPSTAQVEYGEGTGDSYNQLSQQDTNFSTNHVVIISGLTPSKVYHLRAISKDAALNETKSIDTVTITPKATDSAFYLVMTTLQEAFGFVNTDNF